MTNEALKKHVKGMLDSIIAADKRLDDQSKAELAEHEMHRAIMTENNTLYKATTMDSMLAIIAAQQNTDITVVAEREKEARRNNLTGETYINAILGN